VVLETECDIVTGPRHDELRLRILQDETGVAPHAELALAVAAGGVEQTRECMEERALPGAGRSY
jgi:hypothetical protein